MQANRREFMRKALGGAALCSSWGSLQLMSAAANAQSRGFPDYKALVCVFLHGGNDSFNTIVPHNTALYNTYRNTRPAMALAPTPDRDRREDLRRRGEWMEDRRPIPGAGRSRLGDPAPLTTPAASTSACPPSRAWP